LEDLEFDFMYWQDHYAVMYVLTYCDYISYFVIIQVFSLIMVTTDTLPNPMATSSIYIREGLPDNIFL